MRKYNIVCKTMTQSCNLLWLLQKSNIDLSNPFTRFTAKNPEPQSTSKPDPESTID